MIVTLSKANFCRLPLAKCSITHCQRTYCGSLNLIHRICWAIFSKLAGLALCLLAASGLQAETVKELHRPSLPKTPESRPPIELNMPSLEQMTPNPIVMVEDTNDPLAPLLTLMKHQKWRAARKLASLMLTDTPSSLHLLFLSGQINEQLNEYQKAIDAYRKMLEINSQLVRPRYELARMLFADGAMGAAEYQFRLVLSLNLPPEVQQTVRQYLQHIAQQRTSWGISIAMIPSTNINNGTSEKGYSKDGVEYVYSKDTQAQSGIGANLSLWGERRFGSKLQWFVKGTLDHNDYKGYELDNSYIKLTTGRSIRFNSTRIQLGLGGHIASYQYELLYKGEVADLSLSHQFSNSTLYFGGIGLQKLRYQSKRDFLDAMQMSSYLGVSHTVAGRTTHSLSLNFSGNQAQQSLDEYRQVGIDYAIRLPIEFQALSFDANIGLSQKRYLAEDAYFEKTRQDMSSNISFGVLKRNWNWRGFAPSFNLSYVSQQSNISLQRKNTLQAMLKITNEF